MRVAIVGSRSMLAQTLALKCASASLEVTRVGRGADADIAFDLAAPATSPAGLAGHDVMVVCASAFGGDTVEGWRENLTINLLGVLALLEAAIGADIRRFLFVSSISAIDARDGYGLSKATAEAMLQQICAARGVELTIVRPAQIYDSWGAAAAHQPFLYSLIDRIAAGQDVSLFGAVDAERNYVHVEDVAEALALCIRDGVVGVFNAVHPDTIKVSQAAETVRRVFGSDSRIAFDPSKPDMARIAIPFDHSLFDRLGLSPRAFSDGIGQIYAARMAAI